MEKVFFQGVVLSVQPRIRLLRSFDESSHTYLGYALIVSDETTRQDMSIGIRAGVQEKQQLKVGMTISGYCVPVLDPQMETVAYYRVSKMKVLGEQPLDSANPPWNLVAPPIPVYRERGPRRLSVRTFETKCSSCMWGCNMAVEIIIDQWNPGKRKYRSETFCYGPKSCKPNQKGSWLKWHGV